MPYCQSKDTVKEEFAFLTKISITVNGTIHIFPMAENLYLASKNMSMPNGPLDKKISTFCNHYFFSECSVWMHESIKEVVFIINYVDKQGERVVSQMSTILHKLM